MSITIAIKTPGKGRGLTIGFVLIILGFFLLLPANLFPKKHGYRYIRNFTSKDYSGKKQNWSILQDKRGCIYVGNQGALLEFDGVSWRRIPIPNVVARALAMDGETGTIYVGGRQEMGFLTPDAQGKGSLQYKSLLHQVGKDKQNFDLMIRIHALKEGIYFRTKPYLFLFQSGKLKVVAQTDTGHCFRGSFECRGELYIRKDKVGLLHMKANKLIPIMGGHIFASKKIFMLAPYNHGKILIGTRSYGFFLYNETNGFEPFETNADDYLRANHLTHGIRLRSGNYALATRNGGLIIMTALGQIKRLYTKTDGILDNLVQYVFEDSEGNLWLAQEKGITKIEHHSPITNYDDRSGLPGIVLSAVRHGPSSKLYAGTVKGLFYLDSTGKFLPVSGLSRQCSFLLSTGDSLFAATDNGVFIIEKERTLQITRLKSHVLFRSPNDPERIWIGSDRGLVSVSKSRNDPTQWELGKPIKNIDLGVHSIAEDQTGDLWLGTLTEGTMKVSFSRGKDANNPVITRYDVPTELNPQEIHVFYAAGHIMFATAKGIFRFDKNAHKLKPDPTLSKVFTDGSTGVFRIYEDDRKHIWLHSNRSNIEAIPQLDGTFILNTIPFTRIPYGQVNHIYYDPLKDALWLAANDGLIHFDTTLKKSYNHDFQTLIRKVEVNEETLFKGYQYKGVGGGHRPYSIFEYKDRNISVYFSAPFYQGEAMTLYQTFLEGYDDQWSKTAPETRKDYTNLDAGTYTFRVRAVNVFGTLGREALYGFEILPPWYGTWWAFFIYALLFFLVMLWVVKWRSGKLEREKKRLEQIVNQRTGEIAEKNQQLEAQTIQLKEQSGKLTEMDKVKTRFFANISHEFRTPLTLIMGPLEEMLTSPGDIQNEEQRRWKLSLMLRNSRRLLNLINQLLELSKIESHKLILEASRQNIIPFLKGIVASFEQVTRKNELEVVFRYDDDDIPLCFDAQKMEDILFNLLSNAVKFTPPGGKITVIVKKNPSGDAAFPAGFLTLSVQDTGPGIARDQLDQVFNRFYQSHSTYEHHRKGSGIGLAIAKELVELHKGRIDVHSLEGRGTEFIVRFPLPSQDHNGFPGKGTINSGQPGEAIVSKIKLIDSQEFEVPVVFTQDSPDPKAPPKNIILLVEDNADARAYIRSSLEPQYKVLEAIDGKEGMEKALEFIPDLIVSDIMMPETDGYELSRVLKNHIHTSHIPIILLTAKAGEEDVLSGLETGADDYITKPFNTKILCARIKNLIDLRSHLQQVIDRDMTQQLSKIPVSPIDKEFIKKLKSVIKTNISDPDFNIEQLCERMDMSQPTLYRKIHALSGESPTEFIRSYRLKRGMRLLEEKFGSVIEVALEVGFSSAAYFTKCFKKKFNRLPSQYLEEAKI